LGSDNWIQVGGLAIDADKGSAWLLGFAKGLDYTGIGTANIEIESGCFYAMYNGIE